MTKSTRKTKSNGFKSDPAKSEVTKPVLAKEQPVKTTKPIAAKSEVAQPIAPKTVPQKPAAPQLPSQTPPAAQRVVIQTTQSQPVEIQPIAGEPTISQPKPRRRNVVSLELVKPEAKSVAVAGSFNEWKPEAAPLTRIENGRWVGDLTVKPGRHEYLFVVDGQWLPDPNAKETVANPFGGRNSVLLVSE